MMDIDATTYLSLCFTKAVIDKRIVDKPTIIWVVMKNLYSLLSCTYLKYFLWSESFFTSRTLLIVGECQIWVVIDIASSYPSSFSSKSSIELGDETRSGTFHLVNGYVSSWLGWHLKVPNWFISFCSSWNPHHFWQYTVWTLCGAKLGQLSRYDTEHWE